MMPSPISARVVADRLAIVGEALADIRSLPLAERSAFFSDRRNMWTAESCVRRSLEALFDLSRHLLARGFARGVGECKEIAAALGELRILSAEEAGLLRLMAGYRNRLVHYYHYHEVSPDELYDICATRLGDIERIVITLRDWLAAHPERIASES